MEVDRRSFVMGMAAGGALLAFGAPRAALAKAGGGAPGGCTLFLGHSDAAPAFARGVRSVLARAGCPEPGIVDAPGGPIAAHDVLRAHAERARGTRWIALVDDGGAALFQELIRAASGRLLARGSHACSQDASVPLRHLWVAASPTWSARALLASSLIRTRSSFAITEQILGGAESTPPPAAGRRDTRLPGSADWVECVGQAVAAAALGLGAAAAPAGDHRFVHRAARDEAPLPTWRLATFVADL
jgi:hypothetical protein